MIPYDELVDALAQWRARQGLGPAPVRTGRTTGASAAMPAASGFAPSAPVLPTTGRTSGSYAAAPAAAVASSSVIVDDFEGGGTEIREEGVGDDEIDVDDESVDVLEEHVDEE